jgi:hypothetical protein
MTEAKESVWQKWKLQFSLAAGVLVVTSVWGTCSYAPPDLSVGSKDGEVQVEPVTDSEPATEAAEASQTPSEVVDEEVTVTPEVQAEGEQTVEAE